VLGYFFLNRRVGVRSLPAEGHKTEMSSTGVCVRAVIRQCWPALAFKRYVAKLRQLWVLLVQSSRHCLPIKYRIQYKVAVTVYKVFTTQEPSYLTDVIVQVPCSSRHLRFCNGNLLQKWKEPH